MKRRLKPARKRFSTKDRPSLQPVDRRGWRRDAEPENDQLLRESTPAPSADDDRLAS